MQVFNYWLIHVFMAVMVARSEFVPVCKDRLENKFCTGLEGFTTEDTLSVRYEADIINIMIAGSNVVGGFLAYGCKSSDNETCNLVKSGTLLISSQSISANLSEFTECVFFGCYKKLSSTIAWYQFKAVTLSLSPRSLISRVPATNQVMPSEPTMVMMNTSLPAVVTATPTVGATSIAGATFIAAAAINEGRANSIQESGDEGKVFKFTGAIAASISVMVVLVMVGIAVLAAKLRKMCQSDYPLIEWENENYRPVQISLASHISCSLATIIDSLERPQTNTPMLCDQLADGQKMSRGCSLSGNYLHGDYIGAFRQETQTTHVLTSNDLLTLK